MLPRNGGSNHGLLDQTQIVDDAWHAFILDTPAYAEFCRDALGRFLHHRPAEAMTGPEYT